MRKKWTLLFGLAFGAGTVIAQDCSVPNVPSQFKARLAWRSGADAVSVLATPVVANMNPHQDDMPEIIVAEGNTFTGLNSRILFFRGDGSNANNPLELNVPGNFDYYPAPGPTIGDVNGNGRPELLITCADRRIRVFNNYTENPAAPMNLWITSTDLVDFIDQRPLLADFDGDGVPEVYAGSDIFKFNFSNPAAPTLTKVINGPFNQGRSQFSNYAQGSCNPTAVDLLSVADCNGDPDCGGLELVAGPVIYSIDLDPNDGDGYQIKVQRNLNNMTPAPNGYMDGYTAVADMDLDGLLDIVVTSGRSNQFGMYVWNKNGLLRFFPYPTNAVNSGSLACIANVYDDAAHGFTQDYPEILVCSSLNYTCFNLHAAQNTPATPYWWNLNTTDNSGWTGSTVYDFNGDGISEIVYRDEQNLRILYGGSAPFPPGVDAQRNWFQAPCFSGTSDEYALVADVDNDGETEIVVTGRLVDNNFTQRGRLHVFESDAGPWVPCRNVWHQYNYFIVNVNDDLSIPAQQDFHHLELPVPGSGNRPLNRYLSQRPLLNDDYLPYIPLPDASALSAQIICDTTNVGIRVEICNFGDKTLPLGTPVTFYQSDPTSTAALTFGAVQTLSAPLQKDSCRFFDFVLPKIAGTYYGVVNDNATLPTPFQLGLDFPSTNELECNFLNNIFHFQIPGLPAIVQLGPDISTCADTTVMLNAGLGFAQYHWQDGSTGSTFLAQQTGLYWVEATDGCLQRQTDTVWIEMAGYPDIQLAATNGDCQGHLASIEAIVQGNHPPFGLMWSSGDTQPSLSGLQTGTYTVTVTNAKGCSSTQSAWVETGGSIQVSLLLAAPILCNGGNTSLSVDFVQGSPPFSVQWSDGSQGAQLQQVQAGSYIVTVTDTDLCADTLSISIDEPPALASNGTESTPTCPGEAIGAALFLGAQQGTPPYSLLWSNNETQPVLTNLSEGAYSLTLTDANGCTILEQVQVSAFEAPVVAIAQSQVSCFGEKDGELSVNILSGTPGFALIWSNQSTTSQIQGLGAGQYALALQYANGQCVQHFDFQITEPLPLQSAGIQTVPVCPGESNGSAVFLGASQGTAPYNLLWSTNETGASLNDLPAGEYLLTVTDANGCTLLETAQVLELVAPEISSNVAHIPCFGEENGVISVQLSGGSPGVSLVWQNGATTPLIDHLPAGNYSLTVTFANGACSETIDFQLDEPPALALANADVTPVRCFGENNGALQLSAIGGVPPYHYAWNGIPGTENLTDIAAGDYSLALTDANGCQVQAQFTVPQPDALAIGAEIQADTCQRASGAIQLALAGGVAPYQLDWSNGSELPNQTQLPAGLYLVTLTDANACTALFSATVPQFGAGPALSTFTGTITCENPSATIGVTADQTGLSYAWLGPNGALPSSPSHTVQVAGDYHLVATNMFGCQTAAFISVLADVAVPVAEAGPPLLDIGCNENQVLLSAVGSSFGSGFLNRWTKFQQGTAVSDTLSLTWPITQSGLYVHSVLNLANGCSAQDSIWVNWDAPIVATFRVDSIRCHGDGNGRIVFQQVSGGSAPYLYALDNQPFSSQSFFAGLGPGQYLLHIQDGFGCTWEQTVTLTEPLPVSVQLSASDTSLVLGQTLHLIAKPSPAGTTWAQIDWGPEGLPFLPMSLQQHLKPKERTEFVVRITDNRGCTAEDRLTVSVYNHNIYVPNIIIPGNDINGWFTVFAGDGVLEVRTLQVYDRWGEQVFQRSAFQPNAPTLGWDGTFRGQPMNPAVFAWYAEVLLQDGQSVFLKGDVTVAR